MAAQTPLTFNYKTTAQGLFIPLDVYLPRDVSAKKPVRPVVWLHTGGFLTGTRKFIPPHFLRAVDALHIAVVAPDFRLCPQVDLTAVLEDVQDAVRFVFDGSLLRSISTARPEILLSDGSGSGSSPLDTSKWALLGSSAGGLAALLVGLRSRQISCGAGQIPEPAVVGAIYPITDVTRSRSPFFYQAVRPLPYADPAGSVIAKAKVEAHLRKDGEVKTSAARDAEPDRAQLYNYARQEGIYASLVLPPDDDGEAFSVIAEVEGRRGKGGAGSGSGSALPPVFLAYGTEDRPVPCEQSEKLVRALEAGEHEYDVSVVQGADHLYDMAADVEEPKLWAFVKKHLTD